MRAWSSTNHRDPNTTTPRPPWLRASPTASAEHQTAGEALPKPGGNAFQQQHAVIQSAQQLSKPRPWLEKTLLKLQGRRSQGQLARRAEDGTAISASRSGDLRVITNHVCTFPEDGLSNISKAISSNKMALKGKLATHWTTWSSSSTHGEEFQRDAFRVNAQRSKATLLAK